MHKNTLWCPIMRLPSVYTYICTNTKKFSPLLLRTFHFWPYDTFQIMNNTNNFHWLLEATIESYRYFHFALHCLTLLYMRMEHNLDCFNIWFRNQLNINDISYIINDNETFLWYVFYIQYTTALQAAVVYIYIFKVILSKLLLLLLLLFFFTTKSKNSDNLVMYITIQSRLLYAWM